MFHHSLSPRRVLSPCSGACTICRHGAFCHLAAARAPFVTMSPRRLLSPCSGACAICHHGAFSVLSPCSGASMICHHGAFSVLSPCSGACTICHHVTTAPFVTLQRRQHDLSPCHLLSHCSGACTICHHDELVSNRAAIVPF